ncbi:MAG TPA: hypothetical protein PKL73_12595 [Polyangiaceae bacterium]|jgi:hypothetical protein|nr:hypothetical protein [Polyangiaceae bacterium]HNZ25232.1 hypothetical protein [Polyangiaceae bacterium]HOH03583.1 hypothetical protein [Polyangiaceae bacterium]HOT11268.1 hypothetical protein [Polyangiaceae bacterium]HPK96203.1 hypothetical protein [Polyangiaceae bacterium]
MARSPALFRFALLSAVVRILCAEISGLMRQLDHGLAAGRAGQGVIRCGQARRRIGASTDRAHTMHPP